MKKTDPVNKKKLLRETGHLTRPPRLEGKAKNAGMRTVRKEEKKALKRSIENGR